MAIILATLLTIVIMSATLTSLIVWSVHVQMVKENSTHYGWATSEKFKKEFEKYTWDDSSPFEFTMKDYKTNSLFYASIIQFEGKGMIMRTPLDYILVELYARKRHKEMFPNYKTKGNTVKW